MKYSPLIIARSLIDAVDAGSPADAACDAAIELLRQHCPSTNFRDFVRLLERELTRRHETSHGLLIVPTDHAMKSDGIAEKLSNVAGHPVYIDRAVDPELIGGAILHVDHQRIDASVQGALKHLLSLCLAPIDS